MGIMMWPVILGFMTVSSVLYAQSQKPTFSCEGRTSGYYADVGTGCQVYHMCDGLGRQFSYTCPNATLFQQRMLICDHWYMVNCSKAEEDYSANLLIGQKEKLFVEDNESNPYSRTPRPDLLSHPTASEASIIYRTGTSPSQNIVGANVGEETATNEPSYFLPSHWSTEYSKDSTTQGPRSQYKPTDSTFVRTNYQENRGTSKVKAKAIEINNGLNKLISESISKNRPTTLQSNQNARKDQAENIQVNLASNFKATTPVYPKTVEATSEAADEVGLLPPLPYAKQAESIPSTPEEKPTTKFQVNYKSNFKATTPVYPRSVEATSPDPGEVGLVAPQNSNKDQNTKPIEINQKIQTNPEEKSTTKFQQVNYRSNFKATTPVYPRSVEATSPDPGEVGLVPPQNVNENNNKVEAPKTPVLNLNLDFEAPAFDDSYLKENRTFEPEKPSKFYQPPRFLPDYTEPQQTEEPNISENIVTPKNIFKHMNSDQWNKLRESFLIPDYEFPLDAATRPSYDTKFSSFQAKSGRNKK